MPGAAYSDDDNSPEFPKLIIADLKSCIAECPGNPSSPDEGQGLGRSEPDGGSLNHPQEAIGVLPSKCERHGVAQQRIIGEEAEPLGPCQPFLLGDNPQRELQGRYGPDHSFPQVDEASGGANAEAGRHTPGRGAENQALPALGQIDGLQVGARPGEPGAEEGIRGGASCRLNGGRLGRWCLRPGCGCRAKKQKHESSFH